MSDTLLLSDRCRPIPSGLCFLYVLCLAQLEESGRGLQSSCAIFLSSSPRTDGSGMANGFYYRALPHRLGARTRDGGQEMSRWAQSQVQVGGIGTQKYGCTH